jgi:hypothetical protein
VVLKKKGRKRKEKRKKKNTNERESYADMFASAGCSRWAQYYTNGYALRNGTVLNATIIACEEAEGSYQYAFNTEVEGQYCVGAVTLQQPALNLNDTLRVVGTILNQTSPKMMFAPGKWLIFHFLRFDEDKKRKRRVF